MKIISGGQTGVDRGALDAALELGVECGGWCPAGRVAEDGRIPERYPMKELPTAEYSARTARNVADADGTLIITRGELTGGTGETVEFCRAMEQAYLVIDCEGTAIADAIKLAGDFVADLSSRPKVRDLTVLQSANEDSRGFSPSQRLGTTVLNVAGPRASQWPRGRDVARQIVSGVLRHVSGHKGANE